MMPIYIYIPSVSLILCGLLNAMVVCLPVILFFVPSGFGLIVCSTFSMPACFPQLLHKTTILQF